MTQTAHTMIDRNTVHVFNAQTKTGGYYVSITKYTLTDLIKQFGGAEEIIPQMLEVMAENGKGIVYEVSAHDGARTEWFASYLEARDFAFSQSC